VIIAVGHLRYHEVDELRAGVRRTVADRRLRVANTIRVRRAALALSKASDLHEMFEATRQLLEFGEFSFANAQVGRVFWSWSATGNENDIAPSQTQWSVRLPLVKDGVEWGWLTFYRELNSEPMLVDINYLADLFRREFTDAAARIVTQHEKPLAKAALAMTVESRG
jgi:hypothetical protein